MKIDFTNTEGVCIAEIRSDTVEVRHAQDALEILANCGYQGASKIIIHANNITPGFFDLKTGIAGEILQKFSTYRVELAIVGDFSGYTSKSLKDFIYESNKAGRINFAASVSLAKEALLRK